MRVVNSEYEVPNLATKLFVGLYRFFSGFFLLNLAQQFDTTHVKVMDGYIWIPDTDPKPDPRQGPCFPTDPEPFPFPQIPTRPEFPEEPVWY